MVSHKTRAADFCLSEKWYSAPMSKLLKKTIAFTLFAIFMVNMAAWSFSSSRLAHEIENSRESVQAMLLEHLESHQPDGMNDGDAPSASEHQLLHAADHLQFFPITVFYKTHSSLPSTILSHFIFRTLPLAALVPPFRPPRSRSFLA